MRNVTQFQDADGQIARLWWFTGVRQSFVNFSQDHAIDQRGRVFKWKERTKTLGQLVKGDYALQMWDRTIHTFRGEYNLIKFLQDNKFQFLGLESRDSTALTKYNSASDEASKYWGARLRLPQVPGENDLVIDIVYPPLPRPVKVDLEKAYEPVKPADFSVVLTDIPSVFGQRKIKVIDLSHATHADLNKITEEINKEREVIVPFDQAIQAVLCTRLGEHVKFVFEWYDRFDYYDDLKARILASGAAKNETQNCYFTIGLLLLGTKRWFNNRLVDVGILDFNRYML